MNENAVLQKLDAQQEKKKLTFNEGGQRKVLKIL